MIELDGNSLNLDQISHAVFEGGSVHLSEVSINNLQRSRNQLEKKLSEGRTMYGINTGFGSLYNVRIPEDRVSDLQKNLLRSHASGVGPAMPPEYIRAMMIVRANTLLKGFSAVRREMVELLVKLIGSPEVPYVPEIGSLGASGDLAPLSHVALCLMGEGEFIRDGKRIPAASVLDDLGISPFDFSSKEGVAFINGTAGITGILAVELARAYDLVKLSLLSSALSFSALSGNAGAFTEWVVGSRPHRGQIRVAEQMRRLLSGSPEGKRIQDPYSLRCIPQVHGAVLDTLDYARSVLETEMNSATDNPLVNNDEVISAGNFHGEPVAFVCDFLAIALTDLGNICERRVAMLVDANMSGLPPFLTEDSGTSSGYMIPQYVAAALCNYNKTLAHPASVDTIPTSANQEDHVSMGMNAALKLSRIIANLRQIIAIEILVASQGIDLAGANLGEELSSAFFMIRGVVKTLREDRPPYLDIERISVLLDSRDFRDGVLRRITI
ncbi:MAG: histidine ammonia-lyase [Candidatus Thermoplasmatota archaeon]|nr:histidine ammonia-lyase [Candidatus Thermoplasmatota archaeon]